MDGCPHTGNISASPNDIDPAALPGADLAEQIVHLCVFEELSTCKIGAIVGISRQRAGQPMHRIGVPVKPSGAGRPRHTRARAAVTAEILKNLYLRSRRSARQIPAQTGARKQSVRDRLRADGVRRRPRGPRNREDPRTVPAGSVTGPYVHGGLSGADTGNLLGVSGRIVLRAAHDLSPDLAEASLFTSVHGDCDQIWGSGALPWSRWHWCQRHEWGAWRRPFRAGPSARRGRTARPDVRLSRALGPCPRPAATCWSRCTAATGAA